MVNHAEDQEGDDLVPLSAINAYLYCERRSALRHLEALYVHNAHTREGDLGHRRADKMGFERRAGVRTERGLWIVSRRLRLYGRADLVEFHKQPRAPGTNTRSKRPRVLVPYPVEYKRGRSRRWSNDDAQLCAQALCLEEMTGVSVLRGAIYHAKSRARREVIFDASLRATTEATIAALHAMLAAGTLPPAELKPRCRGCSLRGHCVPEASPLLPQARNYARHLFKSDAFDPPPPDR